MLITALSSERIRGLIFDGAMFIGNITLVGSLPRLGDEVAPTTAGKLLLLAVVTQMAGGGWKKGFLSQRLTQRQAPRPHGLAKGLIDVVLLFHFILFSVITLLSFALLGIYSPNGSGSIYNSDIWVIIAFVVGGFTTNLVYQAGRGRGARSNAKIWPSWLEFGADGLLWVSVILVTRIFWDGLVALIEPASGIGLNAQGFVLLIAVSFLYIFFYLPSRYLFLVEDYGSVLTWIQMWVAMLPVVWLVVQ